MSNAYATISQFYDRHDARSMAQLSNDRGDGTVLNQRIQNLLDSEASFVDSILTGRYSLPLVDPPSLLTNFVCDKTAIQLYGRRADRPRSFDVLEARWDKWVEDLMSGLVQLPDQTRQNYTPELVAAENQGQSQFDNLPDFAQNVNPFPNILGRPLNTTPQS